MGDASAWTGFLDQLVQGSSFNRATLSMHDAMAKEGAIDCNANFDPQSVQAYARHFASINPWLARPERRPIGEVVTSDRIIDPADFAKTEYHNDFTRPIDIDLAIGLTVQQDGNRSMVVNAMGRRDDLPREYQIFIVSERWRLICCVLPS